MAETLITDAEPSTNPDGMPDFMAPLSNGSLNHRKIEFLLAKKPFNGFSNGRGDFRLETLNPSSEARKNVSSQVIGPSATAGRKSDSSSELLENWLDPELSFGITFRRIGAGLENLGNTCFLNSVLQCLTYTEPLAAYLQSGKHQNSCRTAGFCALCAIQKHVSRALQSTGRILAPKDLVSNLRCISRSFRNSRQEDAHEYMVNLLESMHKCCLPSGVPSESPSAYDRSLVHKIFGGRLRSQVKCMQCSFCSNKFDPFLDLSLEIVKADSLHKALAHFTAKEQLDGGARQYQCQQCKQKVKALKQLTVHKAPYVLTVHLKRFGSHAPGQKIDKKVHFGPTLDLKPFVTGPYDGDLNYTLYGVLVHAGWSTHSGHYYCFVRTSSGMWYSLDDNRVVQVNERRVLDQKAYMLFYVRDRKNVAPKKLVDVVQKDNMAFHALGSKTLPNSSQGLTAIQNGSIEKKLGVPDSSFPVCPSVPVSNGAPKDSVSESLSTVPLQKDPVLKSKEASPQLAPSAKGTEDCRNKSSTITSASKLNHFTNDKSAKKDLKEFVAAPSNCNGVQISATTKDQNDSVAIPPNGHENSKSNKVSSGQVVIPPKFHESTNIKKEVNDSVILALHGSTSIMKEPNDSVILPPKCNGIKGETSQTDPGGEAPEEKAPVRLVDRTRNGDCKIDGLSKETVEPSSLPAATSFSLQTKTRGGKPRRKLKRKFLKCQATSILLAPNILLGASMGMRKRKKQKRSKHRNLECENLSREHMLDGDFITKDLEPSTSEKTRMTTPTVHSHREGTKPGSDRKDHTAALKSRTSNIEDDSLLDKADEEFRERVGQNGAMHATDEQSRKTSNSASLGNQGDTSHNNSIGGGKESMQNGLMSILTRGIEETIVSRWDGVEKPSRITNSNGAMNVSIGYVADEWDEEYDRGKRKKVRISQHEFGAPNPFQEIATKKANLKKAKLEHYSHGNQPFRI